ncbi:hypothetical protein AMATHDRAFT_82908 [Amanita thiersii Skay4041]|uniref:Vacuolar sorting protein 39/Transforming growth factor beta receptor-associated domain-containing protein n=1 Tax=Amanita thiersii Skay4041 TaxID=703135 RepID=A0A2A9NCF4_9AGAR|nr:hypothetical protein AMATHDRAFT_82908 [Amanita thiersii Skay4041]
MSSSTSSTFPRSHVLLLGSTSIQSLVPSTLIDQVEALLDAHRIEDAKDLVDQRRKKVQSESGVLGMNESEVEELNYVYQRIGFQLLTETMFDDAGKNLFEGNLDPRLLISYYPHLRGNLFTPEDTMDVFQGVADRMPTEASVNDIIAANLVLNYSPHLAPNTRTSPPAVELRNILVMAAEEMLESFLRRWRAARWKPDAGCQGKRKGEGGEPPLRGMFAVDTVLVKLYTHFSKQSELNALISDLANSIVLSEVENTLIASGQFDALATIYRQRGEDEKLLDLYAKLADKECIDDRILDPTSALISLLYEKKDRSLTQKWAIWLIERDRERGLKLLMPPPGKRKEKEKPEEDLALLQSIRKANSAAADEFLEYLVLQRRSSSKELHTQLALSILSQVQTHLQQNDSVLKLWRAKASSYASSQTPTDTPFLSYFSSTTPDSEHKRARIKLILFLAGSGIYDVHVVKEQLDAVEVEVEGAGSVLKLESAILDGKLQNHRAVLTTLVHDLRDGTSAETYCTLGGEAVVPRRVGASVAEACGLGVGWVGLFTSSSAVNEEGMGKGKKGGGRRGLKDGQDEENKRELVGVLLEVYMREGTASNGIGAGVGVGAASTQARAAKMLDSLGVMLDVVDVIHQVPPTWPLHLTSPFLARSFRRSVHLQLEGRIVKELSAAQNLEVKDVSFYQLGEEYVVEEAREEEGEEGQVRMEIGGEKGGEKQYPPVEVEDIWVRDEEKEQAGVE